MWVGARCRMEMRTRRFLCQALAALLPKRVDIEAFRTVQVERIGRRVGGHDAHTSHPDGKVM
jgi:hypothetical protein